MHRLRLAAALAAVTVTVGAMASMDRLIFAAEPPLPAYARWLFSPRITSPRS
jgi:hypothetical protein